MLKVSSVGDGVDAYQVVTNLGRAMSVAGGRYAVVNASRENRARHTDGLRPGTEHFSDILFAGEWAMEPQLLPEAKNNQTTTLQLFNHGGNG